MIRNSLKAVLFLFQEPYAPGTRASEKYLNPNLSKVSVTINGSPNKIFNYDLEQRDVWEEVQRFFMQKKCFVEMDPEAFYADNKYCLLVDLRSMTDPLLHGTGKKFINNTDNNLYIEIDRDKVGSGNVNFHVFLISDAQMDIQNRQLLRISV